ncbi:MAG: GFA family protein [Halieaceae bacterium]|jgi:hypothetical protein|nr:GFA family protein [Halieaceae bacterium]
MKSFACSCKEVEFSALKPPRVRLLCHCSICQRYNQADYSDMLVYARGDVALPHLPSVSFDTYKPPPNVQRGKCRRCGNPAIELFNSILLPDLVMVPVAMAEDPGDLPAPSAHLFYERRVADIEDNLPRFCGFLRSQTAFFRYYWFN